MATATATITRRAITVTADDHSKTYGAGDPALSYQLTAGTLVEQDKLSGDLERESGQDVGAYAIKRGSLTGRQATTS